MTCFGLTSLWGWLGIKNKESTHPSFSPILFKHKLVLHEQRTRRFLVTCVSAWHHFGVDWALNIKNPTIHHFPQSSSNINWCYMNSEPDVYLWLEDLCFGLTSFWGCLGIKHKESNHPSFSPILFKHKQRTRRLLVIWRLVFRPLRHLKLPWRLSYSNPTSAS